MSSITTILWDVGGVLLTNGWDHQERTAVLGHFQLDREPFEQRHPQANDAWERGRIGVEEYLRQTVFYEPRRFTPQDFVEQMKAQSKLLPQSALGILAGLAASDGLKMVAVNNEARELNDYRIAAFTLQRHLEGFFSSCYLGLRKPDPQIYRVVLDVLQRKPEETAFIDDREENVQSAATMGMNAIRYETPEALRQELARLGIETCEG